MHSAPKCSTLPFGWLAWRDRSWLRLSRSVVFRPFSTFPGIVLPFLSFPLSRIPSLIVLGDRATAATNARDCDLAQGLRAPLQIWSNLGTLKARTEVMFCG